MMLTGRNILPLLTSVCVPERPILYVHCIYILYISHGHINDIINLVETIRKLYSETKAGF